jgi:multiple RNA-binding domain-containing protein 1
MINHDLIVCPVSDFVAIHVIYLHAQEGVILDSFQNSLRSDTTILVKNIPYGTTTSQLEELFSPHGEIVRLLLPPAGTIAVVEMSNSSEASKVFRNVAYRRLGGSVVYLEKAPLGLFRENEDDRSSRQRIHSGVKPVVVSSIELDAPVTETTGTDAPVDRAGSSPVGATLFIKNLNFTTTTEKLVKSFRHLSGFSFARVQTKADPKHPGQTLSMGFGFVGFKDKNDAKQALKALEGFVLDGHALVVKFAQRGAEEVGTESKVESVGKSSTTKMIVKNLPFEATKKDVRALFGYVISHQTVICLF